MTTIKIPGSQVISAEPHSYLVHTGVELRRNEKGRYTGEYKPWCNFIKVLGWTQLKNGDLCAKVKYPDYSHPDSDNNIFDVRDELFYINGEVFEGNGYLTLGEMSFVQDIRWHLMLATKESEEADYDTSYTLERLGHTYFFREWKNGRPLPISRRHIPKYAEDLIHERHRSEAYLAGQLRPRRNIV